MAGVGIDTKIHPTEQYDVVRFSKDTGGPSMSTMGAPVSKSSDRFYEVQSSLTLEEVRYSEMRKKIPGMGRVPRDKFKKAEEDVDFIRKKNEHVTYVKQNFRQIECCKFIPKPNQDKKKVRDLVCHCGEILAEHAGLANSGPMNNVQRDILESFLIPEPLRNIINTETRFKPPPKNIPELQWSKEAAFRTSVTNTFGKINFINVEQQGGSKPAKFIRLSHKDNIDKLLELMKRHWKILDPTPPSLCISVIGGAKSFKLDGKMRETFNTGLIKAAKTTNAWLITSGFNVGVMKAVGQAVSEGQSFLWDDDRITHTLRLIGIGPWGYVKNRKYLESTDGSGKFPANFKTSNVIIHGQPVPLNPNHTHFVFVDDGMRNSYIGATEFRAKFEQTVSAPTEDGGMGIPVVLVILEGGTDAISDASTTLEHKIPVVVCAGTGRAADILAYGYSHTKKKGSDKSKGELKRKYEEKLREKIYDAYGERWKEEEIDANIEKHLNKVKKCMEHRDLISIFHMNKHEDLDIAILSALLKSKSSKTSDELRLNQLKLALTWDRADIAQEEIFREDVLWSTGSLDDILMEAILEDKVEFVQLILHQNVVMKEFLTRNRLTTLYELSLQRADGNHLKKMLSKFTGNSTFSIERLDELMDSLMDKYDVDLVQVDDSDMIAPSASNRALTFKWPYKHLLIWSILMMKQKMAKFSWEMGSEPVTSAIAATRVYGSMVSTIQRNDYSLRDKVLGYKKEFEMLATHVLDECHLKHHEKAMMLVERKSPTWSEMTSMQMASSADDKVYLSSVACQNSIDSIWRRGVGSRWIRVLWTMIFPFLIFTPFLEISPMGERKATKFQKLLTFYTAPITKFAHHALMYIIFLVLFTYLVLVDYRVKYITPVEALCIGWILTFAIDDIYTLLTFPSPTFRGKLRDWYGILKVMDMLNFALALIAFLVRASKAEKYAHEAKVIYCINCIIFFIRMLKLYTSNSSLGPILVMIKKMVVELRMFLLVLVVFLLAYGVASQSLMYVERDPSWTILKDVVYYPYWQLYGELFLEEIESDQACIQEAQNASSAASYDRCRHDHFLVPVLLAGYLIIGNVLLFNLLIAIFNNVFTSVKENSIEIWKFQMYYLTMEFDNKTALVPPFSIVPHVYMGLKWILRKTCCKKKNKGVQFTERHLEFLQLFEKEEMANYLRNEKAKQKHSVEAKLQKRVEELFKLVEEELTADHTYNSFGTTVAPTLYPEYTEMDTCKLEPNGWPKPEEVIKYGRSLQEQENNVANKEAVEEEVVKKKKEKKKKKKHKKEKKRKEEDKEEDEEKIINIDNTTSNKPSSDSYKEIPNIHIPLPVQNVPASPPTDRVSNSDNTSLTPKVSTFLQRRNTPQILKALSDDSDSSDAGLPSPRGTNYNILSKPVASRRKSIEPLPSDSEESDVPRRWRYKRGKRLNRAESSTEDERKPRKSNLKWRSRARKDSD